MLTKPAVKFSQVKTPSTTIYIADSNADGNYDLGILKKGLIGLNWLDIGTRHNRGTNVLWGDGHVNWHLSHEVNNIASWWDKDE